MSAVNRPRPASPNSAPLRAVSSAAYITANTSTGVDRQALRRPRSVARLRDETHRSRTSSTSAVLPETAAASSSGTRPATASSVFRRFNSASLSSVSLSPVINAADTAASTSTDNRPKRPLVERFRSFVRSSTSNSASSSANDRPETASLPSSRSSVLQIRQAVTSSREFTNHALVQVKTSCEEMKDEETRSYEDQLEKLQLGVKDLTADHESKMRDHVEKIKSFDVFLEILNSEIKILISQFVFGEEAVGSFVRELYGLNQKKTQTDLYKNNEIGKIIDEKILFKRNTTTLQTSMKALELELKNKTKKINDVDFRKLLSEKILELSEEITELKSNEVRQEDQLTQKNKEIEECASIFIQRRYQQIKKENGEMSGMEKQKYRRMAHVLTDIKKGYDKEMQRLADECKTIEKEMKDLEIEKSNLYNGPRKLENFEPIDKPAYTTQSPHIVFERSDLETWVELGGTNPNSRAPYRLSDIKDVQNKDVLNSWLAIVRLVNTLKDSKFKSSESPSSSNQSANEFSFAQIEQEVRVLNAALTVLRNREITVRDLGETASVETYEAKIKECNSRVCENSIAGRLTFGECKDLVPILTEEKTEIVKLLGLQDCNDDIEHIIESQLTVLKELEEAKKKLSEAEEKMQREQIDPLVIKQREKAEEKSRLALVNPKTYFKQKIAEQIAGAPISGARISGVNPPTQSQTPLLDGLLGILDEDTCDYCCPGALFDEKIQQIRRFTRTNPRPTIPRQTIPRSPIPSPSPLETSSRPITPRPTSPPAREVTIR